MGAIANWFVNAKPGEFMAYHEGFGFNFNRLAEVDQVALRSKGAFCCQRRMKGGKLRYEIHRISGNTMGVLARLDKLDDISHQIAIERNRR